MLRLQDFDYHLPPERIAHSPAEPRDHSRLLRLNRQTGQITHTHFFELPKFLSANDVLVRNNTKVIPARIFGQKTTGGKCEILLIKQTALTGSSSTWECLTKPGLKPGQEITFDGSDLRATCQKITHFTRQISFTQMGETLFASLEKIGHTPVPPYIDWEKYDEAQLRQIYQTTYAKMNGSVAAPTAGLHFTPELDQKLRDNGVQIEEVTLHVGLGTFLPLQDEQLQTGKLHQEFYELSSEVANRLNQAKSAGKRIIAVGTTTTRTLETCARVPGNEASRKNSLLSPALTPQSGDTDLFIHPGFQFRFVDSFITNFHLPQSSLLMLISSFVSQPNTPLPFSTFAESLVGKAYQEAIAEKYRFYSFGDAMWIE
jgi:S-adenosylmethionine:tRNA ribosyltransferase-isomerase